MSPMTSNEDCHDEGIEHGHDWARASSANDFGGEPCRGIEAMVANPAAVTTPSSVLHDDAHYTA